MMKHKRILAYWVCAYVVFAAVCAFAATNSNHYGTGYIDAYGNAHPVSLPWPVNNGQDDSAATTQPFLVAMIDHNWIQGNNLPVDTDINVSIHGSKTIDFVIKTDAAGHFFATSPTNWSGYLLQRGDIIEAKFGGTVLSMTIQNLNASVDVSANLVTGTAFTPGTGGTPIYPAGIAVSIFQNWNDTSPLYSGNTAVQTTGSFSLNTYTDKQFDLLIGQKVFVMLTDSLGNITSMAPYNEKPYLEVCAGYNWIRGHGFPYNESFTLKINSDAGMTATVTTSGVGDFFKNGGDFNNYQIKPGDVVTVFYGAGLSKSLTVPGNISTTADAVGNVVSGSAPVYQGKTLEVQICNNNATQVLYSTNVAVDSTGNFSTNLPLSGGNFDLVLGQVVFVIETENDDNRVFFKVYNAIPHLQAMIDHNWISCHDFTADTDVTIRLRGGKSADFTIKTDSGGNCTAVGDTYWPGYLLRRGDTIEASYNGKTVSMTIQNLNATADPNTNLISGTAFTPGTGGSPISGGAIVVFIRQEWGGTILYNGATTVQATGSFSLNTYTDQQFDLVTGHKIFLMVTDSQGNKTSISPYNDQAGFAVSLNDNAITGLGFPLNSTVTIAVNSKPELTVVTTTNGNGYFDKYFRDLQYILKAGDTVAISYGAEIYGTAKVISYKIPALTAKADADANKISGAAAEYKNQSILITIFDTSFKQLYQTTVTVDSNGNFSTSLPSGTGNFDLVTGQIVILSAAANPYAGIVVFNGATTIQGSIMMIHNADNSIQTLFEVYMWPDVNAVMDTVTITGPNGLLPYDRDDFGKDITDYRDRYLFINGTPAIGTYTFTVNSNSKTFTSQDTQSVNRIIPCPVLVSPAANAVLTSKTPVFEWSPVSYSNVNIYHRLLIEEAETGYRVVITQRTLGMSSYTVPENILKPGKTYRFQARASDSNEWITEQNQGRSEWRTFTMAASSDSVLSVTPVSQNVNNLAGASTFSVSNTGIGTMPWTASVTSGGDWLTLTSGASGINSGTITCSHTANSAQAIRTATIRVTAIGATGSPKDVTITQAASVFPVPDTGQTKCYNNTAEITCPVAGQPFFGQDAQYNINPMSFTKLDANGSALPITATSWVMVKDNVSGLIWESKTRMDNVKNYADPHDADNTYTWYDSNTATNGGNAGTPGNGTDTEDFLKALNDAKYGGYVDWRLPTVQELPLVVNHSIFGAGPAVDVGYFPNTRMSWYWSSSTQIYEPSYAWGVYLDGGYGNGPKTYAGYVCAVRGGQTGSVQSQRFKNNGDGTITDNTTELTWQQDGTTVKNWEQALAYCEGLTLGGSTDWRLPSIKELQTLADYFVKNGKAAIDIDYFPNTAAGFYWSSTTHSNNINGAWGINFSYGFDIYVTKTGSGNVRAVRGGKTVPMGNLAVLPSSLSATKDSGTGTFSVSNTGAGAMSWTAVVTSGGGWLRITSGNGGTGAGNIYAAYDANTGTAFRTGTIRITASNAAGSPREITVTQAGTPADTAAQVLGAWSDGVWLWRASTKQWTKMASTSNAVMIASGKVDSDAIEDLIGVWPSGLYVRQSSTGQWLKISTTLPIWITAGDLNNDGRDDVIGSWNNDGVYYRNSATGIWTKISTAARQLAAGNIGGVRDDLAGVWNDGVWVRYSANSSWSKIDSTIPIWIAVGDMSGDKQADIVGSYSTGTWYRNSVTKAWSKITTPAEQIATGDIDGDGRDDLIGIWGSSLWVRYGATNVWQQVSTSKPKWITTGRMLEAVQAAGTLNDPVELGEDILDLSNELSLGGSRDAIEHDARGFDGME